MKTWVDADACPVVVKDILFRAVALPPQGSVNATNRRSRITWIAF
jgi:uncharacterized protein YaiI (UPF0178 family)